MHDIMIYSMHNTVNYESTFGLAFERKFVHCSREVNPKPNNLEIFLATSSKDWTLCSW